MIYAYAFHLLAKLMSILIFAEAVSSKTYFLHDPASRGDHYRGFDYLFFHS